jgi:hypothetical protein
MPFDTRRWVDPSQPQTLQFACWLLYANAIIGLVFGGSVLGILGLAASVLAGFGIANEKRWGYFLAVALTGSDTSSNVLFGNLQKVSAEQLGLSPVLMAASNSAGGVMGKMIDAQSIVVASTATQWYGHEGEILRYVFFHSLALAALMGLLIMAQAYLYPFTLLVVH